MKRIIEADRSVIIAADVDTWSACSMLLNSTDGIDAIRAFKLGFSLGLEGLWEFVNAIKTHKGDSFSVIFDYQKAGNDIPEMGVSFARKLREAGVDAAILFPFAGPKTQEAWTEACLSQGIGVITGGVMTHPEFLVSEGGYIADESVERIYRNACKFDCRDFVVPGTKPDWVRRIRGWLVEELGEGNFVLYAPGFISQGGDVTECGRAAGTNWHAIAGRAIYEKSTESEQREAALALVRALAV